METIKSQTGNWTFRLEAHIKKEREYNRELAWIGCTAGNWLKLEITPEKLQIFQDAIRSELLAVEERLRLTRGRNKRRGDRLRTGLRRPAEFHRKLGHYLALAETRDNLLQTRRAILKQCGDACAWAVLRTDPRLILPLFSETRTHNLSSGIGLVGPIQIMSSAHDTGQFLVVENDLTRCLGIGDLTVVRANGRWMHPLPLEIKSKGEFEEGAFVEVDMITAYSNHPLDRELFNDFSRLLGTKERTDPRINSKIERQTREIQERSELLLRVTRGGNDALRANRLLWTNMETVLAKAQYAGYAFDKIEEGIAFVAIRNRVGDPAEATTRRVLNLLKEIGFGGEMGYGSVTSHDFQTIDKLSAVAPPIPLWPIQGAIRTDLLIEELFFACICDPAVWQNAFAASDLEWREENGYWIINRGSQQAFMDPIEVQKLTVGVAFTGYSPKEIAATTAQKLFPSSE